MADRCKFYIESVSGNVSGSEQENSSGSFEDVKELEGENVSQGKYFFDSDEEEQTERRPVQPTSDKDHGCDSNGGQAPRSRRSRRHCSTSSDDEIPTNIVMPSGQTYTIIKPSTIDSVVEADMIFKEMEATRRNHTSGAFSGYDVSKIEKIWNICLWKKYRLCRRRIKDENNGDANERMLWHGSNAMQEIIRCGFDERHASQTGMFGAGVYFAESSSKSNQYAWGLGGSCNPHRNRHCFLCERQLLLCRVALGKAMEYRTAQQQLAHAPPGYHSVKGLVSPWGLQYTENVVYRGEQVYPEYLITYKIKQ